MSIMRRAKHQKSRPSSSARTIHLLLSTLASRGAAGDRTPRDILNVSLMLV
jgi:hypothetical protein